MNDTIDRPAFVTDKHLEYLDILRESGITNMFGSGPYLQKAFKIKDSTRASKIVGYWMQTFSERHKAAK